MDGLLIDSEPFWRLAEKEMFARVGFVLTDAMCETAMGLRVREVIEHWYRLFPWPSPDFEALEKQIVDRMVELITARGELMPGVERVLTLFERRGTPMAIASSSHQRLIDAFIDRFDFRQKMKVVHSAEHEPYGKPHPAVFLSTARKLGVDPHDCLVFEDSINGVIAARAARMTVVAVPEASSRKDRQWGIAHRVLDSLEAFSESDLQNL